MTQLLPLFEIKADYHEKLGIDEFITTRAVDHHAAARSFAEREAESAAYNDGVEEARLSLHFWVRRAVGDGEKWYEYRGSVYLACRLEHVHESGLTEEVVNTAL